MVCGLRRGVLGIPIGIEVPGPTAVQRLCATHLFWLFVVFGLLFVVSCLLCAV